MRNTKIKLCEKSYVLRKLEFPAGTWRRNDVEAT